MQTIMFFALCTIGVIIIYLANERQVQRHQKAKAKIELDNWYRNQLFHIIVRSLNESDDSEYMRAAEEQRKLKAVGNEDVQVKTCVYQDEIGYHDETWIEYEARLAAFIQQQQAERHAEIRRIDIAYYRRWVLNKRLPQSACLFLVLTEHNYFIGFSIVILTVCLGWILSQITDNTSRKAAHKKRAEKDKIIAINGRSFKELPPPK